MNMSHHTKLGRHVCVLNDEIVRCDRHVIISISRACKQSYRYKALANYRINNMYCVDHTMGVTTNIILITTFSVLFVAGIAFAIPTVISKIGVVVKNNQGFFIC